VAVVVAVAADASDLEGVMQLLLLLQWGSYGNVRYALGIEPKVLAKMSYLKSCN